MNMDAEPGTRPKRLLAWGLAYTPAAALAVLLPKCPLCIAAQLALIGVTISLPSYARTLAVIASLVLGSVVIIVARRKRGKIASGRPGVGGRSGAVFSCGGRCGTRSGSLHEGPRTRSRPAPL
jgi:hypothetical protein